MGAEVIGLLIVLYIGFYVVKSIFGGARKPKVGQAFTCNECGCAARHTPRTIRAWNDGLKRSICEACHRRWQIEQQAAKTRGGGFSMGCFGWLCVIALIVVAIAIYQ